MFKEGKIDFELPKEVKDEIQELKKAVLEDSTLVDCYIEELRAVSHGCENDTYTEDMSNEVIHYYTQRRYLSYDNEIDELDER